MMAVWHTLTCDDFISAGEVKPHARYLVCLTQPPPARRIVGNFLQWRDAGKHRTCRPSYTLTDGSSPQSAGDRHHDNT